MLKTIERTRDQKLAAYMRLTKRELAEQLVNANDALQTRELPWVTIMDAGIEVCKPGTVRYVGKPVRLNW